MSKRVRYQKKGIDFALGLPLTLAMLPLASLIALAIKLDSPGPIFFVQRRRGRGYRAFNLIKFRTLRDRDHDPYTGYEMQTDDDRITRVGRVLRRFSLDELPQLLNILAGSMSLVGPRPLDDWESEQCMPEYEARFLVSPGLTGLTQVRGRNALSFAQRAILDVEYTQNQSFWTDIGILVQTPWVVITGYGVYPTQTAKEDQTRWH